MANEQRIAKIRAALQQLDKANDQHWTEDGLPREGIVRKLASDTTISRKDISDAQPGFQREPVVPAPTAGDNVDELTGETVQPGAGKVDAAAQKAATENGNDSNDGAHTDPAKNTGDMMTESEVREVLETRVRNAEQALADSQQHVRDSHKAVVDRQADLASVKADLSRAYPPLTAAENIKQYIASEMEQRKVAHGYGGVAPGSQIDAAMMRSNSRGWRRPSRQGQTQTGAQRVA